MLRQQNEESRATWQHTPPLSPSSSSTGPRFDKDATADILEMAARLQSGEQETLTQAEVEALAVEMGIEPRHVRQAIALSHRQSVPYQRLPRVRLNRRQKQQVVLAPLVYGLYMMAIVHLTWYHHSNRVESFVNLSLFVLPFLLSLWLGIQLRYKRAGALAGLWVIFLMVLGIMGGITIHDGHPNLPRASDLEPLFFMLIGAVASGAAGAALQQWLANRPRPVRPVQVRPSELDR